MRRSLREGMSTFRCLALLPLLCGASAASLVAEVGVWSLDEGSGTVALDTSGFGNDGTFSGSPAWIAGVAGSALEFNGSGQRVLVPDAPSLDLAGSLTIAAWLSPNRTATAYPVKKARASATNGYELSLSSSGKVFARFNQVSSGNTYRVDSARSYPADGSTWLHVAVTYDGQTIKLYLDGVLDGSLTAPGLVIANNSLPLAIGAQDNGISGFDGAIDEVHIFDHALSASELQDLILGPLPTDTDGDGVPDEQDAFPLDPTEWADADSDGTGDNADLDDDNDGMPDTWETQYGFNPLDPSDAAEDADGDGISNLDEYLQGSDPWEMANTEVGAWSLDEGSGTVALDTSGLGNDGSFSGAPAWIAGVVGSALEFHGSGERVLIPDTPSLDLSEALTIAAWLSPNRTATAYPVKKARASATNGYELSLSSTGKVFARFNQVSSGNTYRVNSARSYPADGSTWLHVAVTYDGQDIKLYLDGVLDGTLAAPGLVIANNSLPLAIGAQDDGVGSFDGAVDEVHVFNYALSPSELQDLILGPLPTDTDGDGVPDEQDAFPLDPTEWADADSDGMGDNADLDDDNDGMPDAWEIQYGFNPLDPSDAAEDADGDGISNLDEYLQGSDPRNNPVGAEVGWWSLDEGSGTLALDTSGLGNNGSLSGSPAWITGIAGGGLAFDGSGKRVLVPDAPSLDLDEAITIAAWLRPNRVATQDVIKKGRSGVADGYEIGLSSAGSGGKVKVRFNEVSSGNTYRLYSTRSYPAGGSTWVHVAATYDGQEIKLYLDGVLDSTLAAPGLAIANNSLPLSIGAQDDGSRGFDGAVDEVHVFDYALSPGELEGLIVGSLPPDTDGDGVPDEQDAFPLDPTEWADADDDGTGDNADLDDDNDGMPDTWELQYGFNPFDPSDAAADADGDGISNLDEYLQGSDPWDNLPPGGDVATWSLDEGSGTLVLDTSGFGNIGSFVGSPAWIPGLVGSALEFNGIGERVLVADAPSLDLAGALTIAAWVRPNVTGTQDVIRKGLSGTTNGYEVGLSGTGAIKVRFNEATAGDAYMLLSNSLYPADGDTWLHVAVTYNGQQIKLYLDGVLDSTLTAPGLVITNNSLPLSIGAQNDGSRAFEGAVDQIHIQNVAKSAAEIQELYLADGGIHKQPLVATPVSDTAGGKTASMTWFFDQTWWSVFPDNSGTWVRRLDGNVWTKVLFLSANKNVRADYELLEAFGLVHLLLFDGSQTQLASIEYVQGSPGTYQLWSQRPSLVNVAVDSVAETVGMALDSTERLWIAYDTSTTVVVRYGDLSDHYQTWSSPMVLAPSIDPDDIAVIIAFNGQVGVLWSDQTTQRFGFRVHSDTDPAAQWSADEVPASQSALSLGLGMADDHLSLTAASDGTLYAAVKTGYDTAGMPVLALLVRLPWGTWEDLYEVLDFDFPGGTRPKVLLDEARGKLVVLYTTHALPFLTITGGSISYRVSDMHDIAFGESRVLIPGSDLNNASSTKQTTLDEFLVLSSPAGGTNTMMEGVLFSFPDP